ncbi:MAG: adenylosuccinate lyase [Thermovirgaceae bacterium]
MIERYSTPDMDRIWSSENRYRTWLQVELAVCQAWTEAGRIPPEANETILAKASFDEKRIQEIEAEVHHDVIAFVTAVAETVGPEGRFIHLGMTSSDIIDTAASLLLSDALDAILVDLEKLMKVVLKKANKYRYLQCIGRTHGVHAEPTTLGLKMLNWYDQLRRDRKRLLAAKSAVRVGKISGAVGTYAHCPPDIERRVCEILGLKPAPISTQIIQRDIHAEVLTSLAILGGTVERIALEIRHLQRTEVLEAAEPFSSRQKGSSAMPHKRNPVLSERLCGMARILRGYAGVAMENIALWHERDISHSSTERVIWPDSFHLAQFMVRSLLSLIRDLDVFEENIERNLELTKGLVFSQRVLLALVEKGIERERAYETVQRNAMQSWERGSDFRELCLEDPAITEVLGKEILNSLFDVGYYIRYVDEIFGRFCVNQGKDG